jgi:hypothetical protein
MINLLDHYVLSSIDFLKLSAELFRALNPSDPCQARIELKLSPQAPVNDSVQKVGQIIFARLTVVGVPPQAPESERYFAVEIAMNAAYRIHHYVERDLGFELFNQHHTSLTRQLLPILERRATQALQELNLAHIRLPYDLSPTEPDMPLPGREVNKPSYH